MSKKYIQWYLIISVLITLAIVYLVADSIKCTAYHLQANYSQPKIDSPNFCGVVNIMFGLPLIALWLGYTITILIHRRQERKQPGLTINVQRFIFKIILNALFIFLAIIFISMLLPAGLSTFL